MSVLLIDIGNSKLKWRLSGAEGVRRGEAWLEEPLHLPDAQSVLAASVGAQERLKQALYERYGEALRFLETPLLDYAPFTHCYPHPERLGVDRWLAMLGARCHSKEAVLVVDAGSALTLDLLSADNQHQGGYIVPGLHMAQQALFTRTAKVRPFSDEAEAYKLAPGQDTLGCVRAGVLREHLALVQSVWQEHSKHRLFITGGDGLWLAKELNQPFYGDLIFDGMESLCVGYF